MTILRPKLQNHDGSLVFSLGPITIYYDLGYVYLFSKALQKKNQYA